MHAKCFVTSLQICLASILAVLHVHADEQPRARLPFPPRPELTLNLWRFNDDLWLSDLRMQPLCFDASLIPSWSGYALRMAGTGPTLVAIPAISGNGRTNLPAIAPASLRFWFAPDWASVNAGGNGPGVEVRLLETGAWAADGTYPQAALVVEADGNALRFDVSSGLGSVQVARASIEWKAASWHQIAVLNSDVSGTVLCIDGQPAAIGHSVAWLTQEVAGRTNGFTLGSTLDGTCIAQGAFDELATLGYALSPSELIWDFQQNDARATMGPISGNEAIISSAPSLDDTNRCPQSETVTNRAMLPELYGCALWLDIKFLTYNSSNVIVTLHNTIPGTNYTLLSKTNIARGTWATETNVAGANGQNWTQVTIPMLGRSNLFFDTAFARTYVLKTNFSGLTAPEGGENPPDTMGAVGPNHFVELINGSIAVFDKVTGEKLEETNSTAFFSVGSYPVGNYMVDPRILFDHQAQRWIACAVDAFGSNEVILAVTTNDSPVGLATNWIKYPIFLQRPGLASDFTTLGLDKNGIYLTVLLRAQGISVTNAGHSIVAIKKPEIFAGTLLTNFFLIDTNLTDLKVWTVQPAVNFDSIATNDYAWLIAKGPPQLNGTYRGGALVFRRLQWSNSTARLVDSNWTSALQSESVNYRDYFDIEGTNQLTTPQYPTVSAPQAGGTTRINLAHVGSRFMNAVIRDGFLYTCHHIGLSGSNGTYAGDVLGTNVDRSAVQWLKLRVEAEQLSYYNHGRLYDTGTTNTMYYFYPSIAVNCAADILMGFSASSASSYIGAYFAWRPSSGGGTLPPILFRAGDGHFPSDRWGDYSSSNVDPVDSSTFWTIQEYCRPVGEDWGTHWAVIRK